MTTTASSTPNLPVIETPPSPPVAKQVRKIDLVHGETRVDDYFWLRDKANPDVAAYLEAENAYADAIMRPAEELQQKLYVELLSHIKETDVSVPFREGEHFYYSRTEAGKQYPILCRKRGGLEAPEQVILDVNVLAEGQPFMALGAWLVSDDGNLLAYSTDNTGFRQYVLHVKDLRTGALLPERIEKTGAIAWAADNRTLFYTVEDSAKRHYRVYRHTLGGVSDELIYEESDERFNVSVQRSRSKAFLFIASGSHTTTEVRYLSAQQASGAWKIIAERRQDHEYEVEHHGDEFYIRTNDKGRTFRLVAAPVVDPREQNWKEVVPHRESVMLADMDVFAGFYVLLEREDGLPHLRVTDFKTGVSERIAVPEPTYALAPAQNREYHTTAYRYSYQSMVTPSSVFDFDERTHQSTLLKQIEVPGYDSTQYRSERLWAQAADGTKIPISIAYRKQFHRDGTHPLFLTGYGSYGITIPVNFNSNHLALLDRGFAVAVAHIRGGGDLGKPWHDDGRMLKKRNTFTDFIACAEHLIAEKYTSPDRLVVQGGSAGGLLMGAVANLRPDLFGIIIAKVPFLDVVNTMLDASLPLTIGEYEEWGNPNKKEEYEYIRSYSPYDNLEARAYPTMLVKTAFNDSQVFYHEPAKYVAKMRTLRADKNLLLLKTNMAAGHGGASGRYDLLKEIAFDYAFVLTQLGIN